MSSIFLQTDVCDLLKNRFVVIIGDSIQRAVYKDLVLLLQKNKYLTDGQLRAKGEFNFEGDQLIEGGRYGEMHNGVTYREVRQYQTDFHLLRYYYVTRCYNTYVESILTDLSQDPKPDVVIMNSCLWDISRYGAGSVEEYKKNLEKLFTRLNEALPKSTLMIWNTTMPISKKAKGGFLIPEIEFMNSTLRLDILEANFYSRKVAVSHGCDVLDLHYFLRHQLHRRAGDGVHWDMSAHRRITNLLLTHVAEAWQVRTASHTKQFIDNTHTRRELRMDRVNNNNLNQNLMALAGVANMMTGNADRPQPGYQNSFNHYEGNCRKVEYMKQQNYLRMPSISQDCVSDFGWEPYEQRGFYPTERFGGPRSRHNPYHLNNQRTWYRK